MSSSCSIFHIHIERNLPQLQCNCRSAAEVNSVQGAFKNLNLILVYSESLSSWDLNARIGLPCGLVTNASGSWMCGRNSNRITHKQTNTTGYEISPLLSLALKLSCQTDTFKPLACNYAEAALGCSGGQKERWRGWWSGRRKRSTGPWRATYEACSSVTSGW